MWGRTISPAPAGSLHASQRGRQGAWPLLVACLLVAVGVLVCHGSADPQPTDSGGSRAVLLSEIARIAELLKRAKVTGAAAAALVEHLADQLPLRSPPANAPSPTAPVVGYVQPRVVYGHVHIGKTGGSSLNGNLSLHFERVCGHKGYSYDAFQANQRRKKRSRHGDSIWRLIEWGNRARVPLDIMQEIGYEDCDWISHEATWPIWRQLQGLKMPLELHVPCREPIDHLMSQCNHKDVQFSCTKSPEAEADTCLLTWQPSRFSKQLLALKNTKVKCFDWRAAHDGRYFDFIAQRLQRRNTEGTYEFWATNKKRVKKSECVWKDPLVRQSVRTHLLKLDYYSFCDECMGSHDDLFRAEQGGDEV